MILEKETIESSIVLPDDIELTEETLYTVKAVGVGYFTEQGAIIAPEVVPGDKVVIKGKVLRLNIKGEELLLARAQDVICYERGE